MASTQKPLDAPQLKEMPLERKERAVVSPQTIPSMEEQQSMMVSGTISDESGVSRGGVVTPFPWKLHDMLESVEEEGYAHIVSWQVHGRCFMVHKPREFVELIQKYFNQSKLASFQRQLNLCKWLGVFNHVSRCAPEFLISNRRLVHLLLFSDGFQRLTTGRDKGSYYHKDFLRGKRELCANLTRQKVKGTKVRRAIAPALEPQFYSMPFMPDKNGVTQALPSAATARRLMRIVSLENMQTANDVCFFEGKQFHYFDKSMVLAPSQCDASSLKRESNVIQTWMTVIED